jgi:predicted nucleic acid-binding protein
MPFVLDASVTLAWHFDDESEPFADSVSMRSAIEMVVVPAHWYAEVANGLIAGEWRGRSEPARAGQFISRLEALDVEVDDLAPVESFHRMLPIARAHHLTIYDTFYLELAERRGLELATLDKRLAAAARRVGIPTWSDT